MAKRCQLMLKEIYERADSEGDKTLVVDLGGRMRMMCGAVSGIVTLVGLDCGQTDGANKEWK